MFLENGLEIGEIAPPRPLTPAARPVATASPTSASSTSSRGSRCWSRRWRGCRRRTGATTSVLCVFGGNLEFQPEKFQQEFKRLVQMAGRRVRFFGSYRSPDLPTLMREIDWVVVPSTWWENSPVVIQEAFLHGRPIICSDIGGMAEKVRNRVDGLHFRAGSAESLVDRLVEVLHSPDLWERLRGRIRRPLSSDDAAEQHLALYRQLLAGDGRLGSITAEPAVAASRRRRRRARGLPGGRAAAGATATAVEARSCEEASNAGANRSSAQHAARMRRRGGLRRLRRPVRQHSLPGPAALLDPGLRPGDGQPQPGHADDAGHSRRRSACSSSPFSTTSAPACS